MTHLPDIRHYLEDRERQWLSPYATLSVNTLGREKVEEPSPVRTEFQRDRDRIIHAKAFRRLKHKTQVFIAPLGDHYVTRLTHTLEVSQLARTITRALRLNEDLAEAISLGHDLGHTPFGHVGEEVLGELYPGGFRHNAQSLRVVEKLENNSQGLNLTAEVRDGILNHSKAQGDIMASAAGEPATLEGEVCRLADALAYINHDIGDAVRAGIIHLSDLPCQAVEVLGQTHSKIVDTMVRDVIASSFGVSGTAPELPVKIGMSQSVLSACNLLRDFLFERVYRNRDHYAENARATVRSLYRFYLESPQNLPLEFRDADDPARGVVDYIAGMTDQFATQTALSFGLV
ncbi:deoxyguanosinetriphosphate triphosphohydrolase [Dehalogenimonas etheniformans]|uniref:Deoxyguanosinetriphosphate triphosphohydrolase n=1 Tax=Dehalogenimonas etheniformans TaxID=1536648 RepID=A0A2P5P9K9_9CHLR|nr:deoxyguanosinetriphosphate triphosphohydrolase [Dehalogenimonas etheniformans]PPD58982.1 deoxyguanosinetriphosphate triphosphohydrolase [Dehalogenimonas etheniformans]QNT76251.1 deoxyguanosinetriphosphate triphosphohydrolase [Dehalogenimonas etheniformans]